MTEEKNTWRRQEVTRYKKPNFTQCSMSFLFNPTTWARWLVPRLREKWLKRANGVLQNLGNASTQQKYIVPGANFLSNCTRIADRTWGIKQNKPILGIQKIPWNAKNAKLMQYVDRCRNIIQCSPLKKIWQFEAKFDTTKNRNQEAFWIDLSNYPIHKTKIEQLKKRNSALAMKHKQQIRTMWRCDVKKTRGG